MLVGDDLPELGADLVAALARLYVHDLPHGCESGGNLRGRGGLVGVTSFSEAERPPSIGGARRKIASARGQGLSAAAAARAAGPLVLRRRAVSK